MRLARFYYPHRLVANSLCEIEGEYRHRLANVLRLKVNDKVRLFNGQESFEYAGSIIAINKKKISISVYEKLPVISESTLNLILWQAISRSDRMDYSIQKAVELGVITIQPVKTERSPYTLKGEKLNKKMRHWQQIIIHACEQSGRSILPVLKPPENIATLLSNDQASVCPSMNKWLLNPTADQRLKQLQGIDSNLPVIVFIGSEGGVTKAEEALCMKAGFSCVTIGPRILRTETASSAILAWAQFKFGDMG